MRKRGNEVNRIFSPTKMSIAVALHVGTINPLTEILQDIGQLRNCAVKYDLFVNLVEGKVDIAVATKLVKAQYPTAKIITSENRGMDIGGFFRLLPYILKGDASGAPYDYILKLHTKSTHIWRRQLITPLCGDPSRVQRALAAFVTNPKVGMVGAASHIYREPPYRKPNFYYLSRLAEKFGLPYGTKTTSFVGGTVFFVRTSIIESVFKKVDLEGLVAEMSSPDRLDSYWYLLSYYDKGVNTVEEAEQHYKTFGEKAGRFRNCLDARERGSFRCIPDGMIEHAYERLFGLIVEHLGYKIHGAY